MQEIQNVGCLDAFPFVPLKPHSRQPSLSALLLGVATVEVSQAGESVRILSGRYSEMAEKDSTNDEAVGHEVTGGT